MHPAPDFFLVNPLIIALFVAARLNGPVIESDRHIDPVARSTAPTRSAPPSSTPLASGRSLAGGRTTEHAA